MRLTYQGPPLMGRLDVLPRPIKLKIVSIRELMRAEQELNRLATEQDMREMERRAPIEMVLTTNSKGITGYYSGGNHGEHDSIGDGVMFEWDFGRCDG